MAQGALAARPWISGKCAHEQSILARPRISPAACSRRSAGHLQCLGLPAVLALSPQRVRAPSARAVGRLQQRMDFPDGEKLPLDLAIANLERIVRAVDLPVSIDLEAGYGARPEDVDRSVTAQSGPAQSASTWKTGSQTNQAFTGSTTRSPAFVPRARRPTACRYRSSSTPAPTSSCRPNPKHTTRASCSQRNNAQQPMHRRAQVASSCRASSSRNTFVTCVPRRHCRSTS